MKFDTKLWRRSRKSFATTIPHIALLSIDDQKDYDVIWKYEKAINKWTLALDQKEKTAKKGKIIRKRKKFKRKFRTKLWKRSNTSFATTIPQLALLSIDENSSYKVIWKFDNKIKQWYISLEKIKNQNEK